MEIIAYTVNIAQTSVVGDGEGLLTHLFVCIIKVWTANVNVVFCVCSESFETNFCVFLRTWGMNSVIFIKDTGVLVTFFLDTSALLFFNLDVILAKQFSGTNYFPQNFYRINVSLSLIIWLTIIWMHYFLLCYIHLTWYFIELDIFCTQKFLW